MEPERHEKGWGYELWIVNNNLYCGKILHFNNGKKCSRAHSCRYCVTKDGKYRTHREIDCEFKNISSMDSAQTPFLGAGLSSSDG